ncbi:MAG: hypothetical protein ACI30A_06170 [Paludibacteraceae bacterium]
MKKLLFLLSIIFALVACEDRNARELTTDTDSTLNQPADPATWSPAGKVYVYHHTYDKSPAEDKYWAWVLDFFSEDSLVRYETPNRDLSYSDFSSHTIDSIRYSLSYPTISYENGGYIITLVYKDTLTIIDKSNEISYSIFW